MGFCYIIRKLRFACDFYSGFTRGEYHIALVDFIAPCGGTKGRRRWTLRSPSPPSSGLHLLTPGESAAAGHICCRGGQGYRKLVSGAGRLSPLRRIDWVLCVRAEVACVSENHVGHWVVRFSLVVDGLFVPAATWRFAMDICWDYR